MQRLAARLFRGFVACQFTLLPAAVVIIHYQFSMEARDWRLLQPLQDFAFPQRLYLARTEFLVCLFLAPLATAIAMMRWDSPRRHDVLTAIGIALIALFYVEFHALHLLGGFVSIPFIIDGVRWGIQNPALGSHYVTAGSILRLCAVVLAALGWNYFARREWLLKQIRGRPFAWGSLVSIQAAVLIAPYASNVARVNFHRSVFTQLASALTGEPEGARVPLNVLKKRYGVFTPSSGADTAAPFFRSAAGSNVILFVLETAPALCLPLDQSINWAPAISKLRERAWVGIDHFTTYPFTKRALFSILTSMYPPELASSLHDWGPSLGMLKILKSSAYRTGVYGTGFNEFESMFTAQSVDRLVTSACRLGKEENIDSPDWLANQLVFDQRCLDEMLGDIAKWAGQNRKFAVVYGPQASHGPWQPLSEKTASADPLVRCRDLVALEDRMLDQVVKQLESERLLDHTLIVVTGDHGVRFVEEDARFRPGHIDDYTYHVPLLLYAPMTLKSRQTITSATSHIDIQPSVLDLLGIRDGRELEQGSAIWHPELRDRTVFFWGERVIGASGYERNDQYFMRRQIHGDAYASDRFSFSAENRVPASSPLFSQISRQVDAMDAIRRSWLRCAQADKPLKSCH